MPHDMEWQVAEEICNRFPVEMCRFSSGTEATMHAIRLAAPPQAATRSNKFERLSRLARQRSSQREAARTSTVTSTIPRRSPAA